MRSYVISGRPQLQAFTRKLSIDIETFSSIDLKKCGLHKYVTAKDFEILLFSYRFDDGPVTCVDLANFEDLPEEVYLALLDPTVLKKAWNAQFEFVCIKEYLKIDLDQTQWQCTMIQAANLSLPMGLAAAAIALGAPFRKDFAGAALIKYFCIPCNPTKLNGQRTRNLPHHYPERWEDFKRYCNTDVMVESSIGARMEKVDFITDFEKRLYWLDQKINNTGVKVDIQLVENAITINEKFREERIAEAKRITGLNKPNSVKQLKEWLNAEMDEDLDEEIEKLRKEDVLKLIKISTSADVTRVLEIRQQLGKSSVSKYIAMRNGAMYDDRIRGLFQFYGASRTGRWAGRLVQMQNLPRNEIKWLNDFRDMCLDGDGVGIEMMHESVPYVLSQLIRTAFIPEKGNKFAVIDYSAIEAVVLAWLAGEKWRMDVFRTHGKIYEASASMMFGIPLSTILAGVEFHDPVYEELRQRGKVAELALGFGGAVGAITTMDLKKKIKDKDKQPLVDNWRAANPAIVRFWRMCNDNAIHTISTGEATTIRVSADVSIRFTLEKGIFFITLPSGRKLAYLKPRLGVNRFGGVSIVYKGADQKTHKWTDLETYGGKLTENIVQAVARDLLAEAMLNVDEAGFNIVAHVHDEIIVEVAKDVDCMKTLCDIMTVIPDWAPGLPLKVKGFETQYYKKD